MPTGVAVQPSGKFVFVTAYDSTVTPHLGYLFAFSVGTGGVLTPVSGSPFAAGAQPSAVASDASGNYVYATDYARNQVLGFSVSAAGALTPLSGSPLSSRNRAGRHRGRSGIQLRLCRQLH